MQLLVHRSLGAPGKAIIFVHGLLSNDKACWTDSKTDRYWPDMVSEDEQFAAYAIYVLRYEAGPEAGQQDTEKIVDNLWREMEDVLKSNDEILFVCHSLGGVVVRKLLVKHASEIVRTYGQQKRFFVALFASPALGSRMANVLFKLIPGLPHRLAKELRTSNRELRVLNSDFRKLQNQDIFYIEGDECFEHHMILRSALPLAFRMLLSERLVVVDQDSAGACFGRASLIENSDHWSIVKPNCLEHESHKFLQRCLRKFEFGEWSRKVLPNRGALYDECARLVKEARERIVDTTWGPAPESPEKFEQSRRRYLQAVQNCKVDSYRSLVLPQDGEVASETQSVRTVRILPKDWPLLDFMVVDGEFVAFSRAHASSGARYYLVKNKELASVFEEWFEDCWRRSAPSQANSHAQLPIN